jgi:hypothetical protein
MKNFKVKYIATLIGVLFVGLHYLSIFGLSNLVILGAVFPFFYGLPIKPLFIQTVGHSLLFLIFGILYYLKIKKDKKINEFKIVPLLLYYLFLAFSMHSMYYFLMVFLEGGDYRYDANDFIGLYLTSYESCFLFPIFGLIIDFIKNRNGIPKIKLY